MRSHSRSLAFARLVVEDKRNEAAFPDICNQFYEDDALLGQHLFGKAKTRKVMQESVAACNKAISLAPSFGDGYMCRAFPLAALGNKAQAVKDVSTAKTLYLRAGNEKEAGIIDRFELENLVRNQPLV